MCCFSGKVESVSDTQIFARLTGKGTQYLAYQMKYESKSPNAMILPLPIKTPAKEKAVRFIDLSQNRHFFRDLAKGFPIRRKVSRDWQVDSAAPMPTSSIPKLKVHDVGNFVASFVPTMDDFGRLDPQFVIPKETWLKIPGYKDYGFAVFQLKEGAGKPHPMAFEFATRMNEKIFFPTVHIHDGEVHQREHFDHTLYMQHAGYDSVVGKYVDSKVYDKSTGLIRSHAPAKQFCDTKKTKGLINENLLVHRIFKRGTLNNIDMTFAVKGDANEPAKRTAFLPWILAPVAITGGLFSWIIARRNQVREAK